MTAASQLGADLQAALTVAHKDLGLSHGKCRRLMERLFGITISRSTNCRAQQRLAEQLWPSYDAIGEQVRSSPRVVCDETGWRVDGRRGRMADSLNDRNSFPNDTQPRGEMNRPCRNAWLHDFVTEHATYYAIDPTRSAEPALLLLGEDYSGTLIHDGWSVYDRFTRASHQQCLARTGEEFAWGTWYQWLTSSWQGRMSDVITKPDTWRPQHQLPVQDHDE